MAETSKVKAAPKAKTTETREQKFERLAIPRVTKALKAIDLIGNLSGSNYAYNDDQVVKMFGALNTKLTGTQKKFTPRSKEAKEAETFGFGE